RSQRSAAGDELWDVPARSVETDQQGRFDFPDVRYGSTQLRVDVRGLPAVKADLTIEAGRTGTRDLGLPDGARVGCVLRDRTGMPVSGARVKLAITNDRLELCTGVDGTCAFVKVPPGAAEVQASRRGAGRATQAISLVGRQQHTCELQLVPTPAIRGRLLDD